MNIPIIYQDAQIIVCLKPVDMQSEHAQALNSNKTEQQIGQSTKSKNSPILSLPDMLFEQENLHAPLFVVHRLDVVVGGVMVFAKTKLAAANLSEQINNNTMQKTYRAIVSGFLAEKQGIMEDFLYHDKRKGRVYPVKKERKGVKKAILNYNVICEKAVVFSANSFSSQKNSDILSKNETISENNIKNQDIIKAENNAINNLTELSLLEIHLQTGRTHQIRAQCASRKHPLLGDGKYGSRVKLPSPTLWSYKLEFNHPKTGENLIFCENMPSDFPWDIF